MAAALGPPFRRVSRAIDPDSSLPYWVVTLRGAAGSAHGFEVGRKQVVGWGSAVRRARRQAQAHGLAYVSGGGELAIFRARTRTTFL